MGLSSQFKCFAVLATYNWDLEFFCGNSKSMSAKKTSEMIIGAIADIKDSKCFRVENISLLKNSFTV